MFQQTDDGKQNKDGAYALLDKIKDVNEDIYNKFKPIVDTCTAESK